MQPSTISRGRLLSFENPREYRKDVAGLIAALQPSGAFEQMLVEELAQARWDWNRARAVDCQYWDYAGSSFNRATAGLAEADLYLTEKQTRAHRYRMLDCERRYYRALAAVERMQRDRGRRKSAEPPAREPVSPPPERAFAVGGQVIVDMPPRKKRNEAKSKPAMSPAAEPVQNEPNGAAVALALSPAAQRKADRILRRAARNPVFAPRPALPAGPAMPVRNEANPEPTGPPKTWETIRLVKKVYHRVWRKQPDGSVKLVEICVN